MHSRALVRLVLVTFLVTFAATRVLVFLIMARWLPDLYLHLGGTHVHHLNHGILLLSICGGWLLFARPQGHWLSLVAILYGIGLALTFDEFGMWLHLGGGYWQRASFDAITVVASMLGLLAFAPTWSAMRARHWTTTGVVTLLVGLFFVMLVRSLHRVETLARPWWERLERQGPK